MSGINSLKNPTIEGVLDRLHAAARGDRWKFAGLAPQLLLAFLTRKDINEVITAERMKDFYIPVSREQGNFLYLVARALNAQRIVEFGTSFGISTIYLAAAVRDNGGEVVIGTELEPTKHKTATENLAAANLSEVVDIRLGDATETLKDVPEPIDMVLLDGWKDLYLPVLKLLTPRLRKGAVVLADNIYTFKKSLRPYVEYVQSGDNGFQSETLSISDGFEFSVFEG